MKNKKTFYISLILVMLISITGFYWLSPVLAGNIQKGSVKVNIAGLTNKVVIKIKANGVDTLGNPLSAIGTLIINPPPTGPVDGVCSTSLNTCTTGSFNDIPDNATKYLWQCKGQNGGNDAPGNCSASKAVPAVDMKVNGVENSITVQSGDPLVITWSYSGITDCDLDPTSMGSITPPDGSGSFSTSLLNSKTFTISCNGGTISDSVIVNVNPAAGLSYELNIIKSGQGMVVPDHAGAACAVPRASCWDYNKGESVVLTAIPATHRIFTGWGGACAGTPKTSNCTVIMNAPKNVLANFAVDPNYVEF
jgi:hypothetical protein